MAQKYIGLEEETTYGTEAGDGAGSGTPIYFKILSESIEITRNDYYPETTEYWTTADRVEGHFTGGGDLNILVEPVQFPKLLVLFIGDGTTVSAGATGHRHTWSFGANEVVSATGMKPCTIFKGVGIEKDRMFEGGFVQSLAIEAVKQQPVSCTVGMVCNGNETLISGKSPTWTAYTQRYFSFADVSTFTIGGADRLTTGSGPTVEAFRLNLTRGFDTDHYILGNRYLSNMTPSGMASVEGSVELSFATEDEHERYLSVVDGTESGHHSGFGINLILQGNTITSGYPYELEFTLTDAYYTGPSSTPVASRDRIIQTLNFKGQYNSSDVGAIMIEVQNITSSYTTLS